MLNGVGGKVNEREGREYGCEEEEIEQCASKQRKPNDEDQCFNLFS